MRNSEFLSAVYGRLRDDYGWTTSFASDPGEAPPSVWSGSSWSGTESQKIVINKRGEDNNYYSVGVMNARGGNKRRAKEFFTRLAVLLADDLSAAALNDLVGGYSYALETSRGNYQVGVLLDPADPDTKDVLIIDAVLQAMGASGYIKADSSGNNPIRYARLPVGTNTKKREDGQFTTRLLFSKLDEVYTLADAVATFGLDLDAIKRGIAAPKPKPEGTGDAVDLFKAIINPNLEARSYHDPLMKLSASLVASGLKPGATVNLLRSVMLASKPEEGPELDRWRERFGSDLVRMVQGAEKYQPKEPEPVKSTNLTETHSQVKEATKNIKWLVKNVIPQDAMGMLFGASGTFKSFIAIDLALSVLHGQEWTKRKTAKGAVYYVAAEGGAGVSRRVDAWHRGVDVPENLYYCRTPLLLSSKEEIGALRASIAALPEIPVLIIIDTLSQTFAGDENSSSDIATYLRMLNSELRAAFNCTVLVIHHTGHSATERPRGSSAITANVDFLLGCYRSDPEGMNARVDVTKQKDGDLVKGMYFDLDRHVLGQDDEGDEITSLVANFHDAVAAIRQNNKGSKYESLVMSVLATGQRVTDAELRVKAMEAFTCTAQTAGTSILRATKILRDAQKIREAGRGIWVIAD
jgi:hypothetical protein